MASPGSVEFVDCTSLSIQYDVMGLATVTLTIIANSSGLKSISTISLGEKGKVFTGFLVNASGNKIPGTTSWYESHIALIGTVN